MRLHLRRNPGATASLRRSPLLITTVPTDTPRKDEVHRARTDLECETNAKEYHGAA